MTSDPIIIRYPITSFLSLSLSFLVVSLLINSSFFSPFFDSRPENCCLPWLIHCNRQLTQRSRWCWCRVSSLPHTDARGHSGNFSQLITSPGQDFMFYNPCYSPEQLVQIYIIGVVWRENLISGQHFSSAAAYGLMQMGVIVAVSINATHALTSVTLTLCYYHRARHMTHTHTRTLE